jgi:DNA polymerase-3 subunit gamma/tau
VPAHQQAEQPQSLYRRHRPRTFDQIVGQEAVVRTLRNAVAQDKVHHAYLFVGSRGTGKTSMAKILAACLNCERGPTVEPCGSCESCVSIAAASSLDVIELDAASSNSVDDIRELRESVAYAPVSGRRKVYILDEAHMLSTAAWNAFLKTLEEPPPSTVFVLATTEAQKVPATVIDRCHRFDFQRPSVEQIGAVVGSVAQQESIQIPPAAVAAIARAAAGSFRDALGTLEQLVTYSGSQIALDDALAVLGVTDAALLATTIEAVASGDAAEALRAIDRCASAGRDAAAFASDLERHARELLVVATLGDVPPELSLTPEADAHMREQALASEPTVLVRLLELLGEAMEAVRAGADARTRLELALVKAARPELDSHTRTLLARVERIERGQGSPQAATPTPATGSTGKTGQESRQSASPQAHDDAPSDASAAPAEYRQPAAVAVTAPAAEGEDSGSQPAAAPPAAEPAEGARGDGDGDATASGEELQALREAWPAVVEVVRSENALLGALIQEARPVAVAGSEVTVAFSAGAPFLKKKAEDTANRRAVSEALCSVVAGRWTLAYTLGDEPDGENSAPPPASEEEWIKRLMQEFDAEELPAQQHEHASESAAAGDEAAASPAGAAAREEGA